MHSNCSTGTTLVSINSSPVIQDKHDRLHCKQTSANHPPHRCTVINGRCSRHCFQLRAQVLSVGCTHQPRDAEFGCMGSFVTANLRAHPLHYLRVVLLLPDFSLLLLEKQLSSFDKVHSDEQPT